MNILYKGEEMVKMKIFVVIVVLLLSGCCIAPYGGRVRYGALFDVKVRIIVDTSKTIFSEAIGRGGYLSAFSSQIKRAIETDLQASVFPNVVEIEEDMVVNVNIVYIYVNIWCAGEANVKLTLMTPDGIEIRTYSATGSCGLRLTIIKAAMDAVGDAMQKIKFSINEDRDEINKEI